MKTEFKYIRFDLLRSTNKTSIWSCKNIRFNYELGIIKWYGPWREYCFFPITNTIFSDECLLAIVEFLESLEKERRQRLY